MNDSFYSIVKKFYLLLLKGVHNPGDFHPFIIHFPIALFTVAPLFILFGLFSKKRKNEFYLFAALLMLIGLITFFAAFFTGEKASETLDPPEEVITTLEAHVHGAEQNRLIFSILTIAFFIYVWILPSLDKTCPEKIQRWGVCLYLFMYCSGIILLFHTAHEGGRLVHVHSLQSGLYSASSSD